MKHWMWAIAAVAITVGPARAELPLAEKLSLQAQTICLPFVDKRRTADTAASLIKVLGFTETPELLQPPGGFSRRFDGRGSVIALEEDKSGHRLCRIIKGVDAAAVVKEFMAWAPTISFPNPVTLKGPAAATEAKWISGTSKIYVAGSSSQTILEVSGS